MFRLTVGCVLTVPLFAVAGPDLGRSFPDVNCAFSLPGKDWEWLDPAKAPASNYRPVAFARSRSGAKFWLKVRPMAAGEAVGPDSYENLERSLISKSHTWTRVGSKHITFKGVPAFQIDFQLKESKACGRFVFLFADNRSYMLAVQTPGAELGPEADTILDRFTFLNPPQPMMRPQKEKPPAAEVKVEDQVGDTVNTTTGLVGNSTAGLGGLGVFVLILFGVWMMIRGRG
jgi:hypothetical protein